MKKYLTYFIKISVTLGLLFYVFKNYLNIDDLKLVLNEVKLYWIWPLIGIHFLFRILQALQMHFCFLYYNFKIKVLNILRIQFVSTFFTFFLPGDIIAGGITWHMLSKNLEGKMEIASIVLYLKLLNLATLIPFGVIGVVSENSLTSAGIHYYLIIISFILIIFIVPFMWYRAALILQKIADYFLKYSIIKPLKNTVYDLINAIFKCSDMALANKIIIILMSFFINIISIIWLFLAAQMSGIEMPALSNLWLLPLLTLIHALPVTLNGTGLREFTLITVLNEFYSVKSEKTIILSLIIFFIGILCGFIGGILMLFNNRKQLN